MTGCIMQDGYRRRAVCASYIAMADGRDSEKDFPNGISSPRTAYIFHDRGRANRLPLLSSIFCAPGAISAGYGGSMWTNGKRFAKFESWIAHGNWLGNQNTEDSKATAARYVKYDETVLARATDVIWKNCRLRRSASSRSILSESLLLSF